MTSHNKQSDAFHVSQMLAGTLKQFPNGSQSLPIGGKPVLVSTITNAMQALVTNRANTVTAQNAAQAALAVERAEEPALLALVADFTRYLRATVGTAPDALAIYDLTPPKAKAPRTVVQKVVAAAKTRATREARGTTSKKQKLAITGNVTGLTMTPVTMAPVPTGAAPVAQAQMQAPAPAASSVSSAASPGVVPK